jgi:hypothetical protein
LFRKGGFALKLGRACASSSRPSPRKLVSTKLSTAPSVVFVELIGANAVRTDWGLEFVGLSTKVFGSDQRSAMLTVCRSYTELDTVDIRARISEREKKNMTYCSSTENLTRTPGLHRRQGYLRGQCGCERSSWTSNGCDQRNRRSASGCARRRGDRALRNSTRCIDGVGGDGPFGEHSCWL